MQYVPSVERLNISNVFIMLQQTAIYQVSGADLMNFANHIMEQSRKDVEATLKAQQIEQYLSPEQVSEMLSVDLSTLWRWNKRGYLTHSKVGAHNRYKLSDVKKLLEGEA
ncbi:MAG: helix-turn-helix domain-containing protein [Rikenellaceae bacterium]